jgi:hypothetical protein
VGAPNRPGVGVTVVEEVGATVVVDAEGVEYTVGVGATVVDEVGVTDVIGESLLGGIRFFSDSSRLLR